MALVSNSFISVMQKRSFFSFFFSLLDASFLPLGSIYVQDWLHKRYHSALLYQVHVLMFISDLTFRKHARHKAILHNAYFFLSLIYLYSVYDKPGK